MEGILIFAGTVVVCVLYVVARLVCMDMRKPKDTYEGDLQSLIRKHEREMRNG